MTGEYRHYYQTLVSNIVSCNPLEWFFPRSQLMSLLTFADKISAKCVSRTHHRSSEYSAQLSSFQYSVLLSSSCLGLPRFSALFIHLRNFIDFCLERLRFPMSKPGHFFQILISGNFVDTFFVSFPFLRNNCLLLPNVQCLKLLFYIFCIFFGCLVP